MSKLKVYISLNGNKLTCFVNNKGPFQVLDLVYDF